jgi:hypothetical protein
MYTSEIERNDDRSLNCYLVRSERSQRRNWSDAYERKRR